MVKIETKSRNVAKARDTAKIGEEGSDESSIYPRALANSSPEFISLRHCLKTGNKRADSGSILGGNGMGQGDASGSRAGAVTVGHSHRTRAPHRHPWPDLEPGLPALGSCQLFINNAILDLTLTNVRSTLRDVRATTVTVCYYCSII